MSKRIDIGLGDMIYDAVKKTIQRAKDEDESFVFEFNGVDVHVSKDSDYDEVIAAWEQGIKDQNDEIQRKREEWLKSPEGIEHTRKVAERKAAQEERRKMLGPINSERLYEFSIREDAKETFDKGLSLNTDGYGRACFTYASAWAQLMEKRMAGGEELDAVVEETSHDADIEGITGFMFSAAKAILHDCWIHGDKLMDYYKKEAV